MSSTSLTILVGRFMPVVVFALFGYTYYVFLVRLCVQTILVQQNETVQAIVYLVLVNVLFFLMLLSYLRILFRGPGSPLRPPKSRVTSSTTAPMPGEVPYTESSNIPSTTQPAQHTVITIPQSNPSVAHQSPNKDTIQPMETAVLRTSPNPLPTISEVGTPRATTDAEMGLATTTTTASSSAPQMLAPLVQIPASSSAAATPRMPSMFVSKKDGRLRWCDRCNTVKPDRTHHCSECDECVLKMDHHCPWVNGCVGYYNYKYFYLFILYTSLYADFCFAATVSAIAEQLKRAQDVDIQWIVLLILAFLFGLLLTGFTVVHTSYIFLNRTTIESISHDSRQYFVRIQLGDENHGVATTNSGDNLWDLGWRENFKSVMGKHWWLWCVPFGDPLGDGLSFPFNSQIQTRLTAQAKRQAQLQEDRMVMMMQHAQQGVARLRQFE